MKKFSQIILLALCVGILAVALSSIHSRPASAQNQVTFGGLTVFQPTHLGVPFVNLVTLDCTEFNVPGAAGGPEIVSPCAQFTYVNLNGTLGNTVTPGEPTGNLVITDVSWTVVGTSSSPTVDTFCLTTTSNACVLTQTGLNFWPNMVFSDEDHLTGGLAVTVMPGVTLSASQGTLLLTQLTLRGYRAL
jgi:hypothetical protein